MTSEPQTSSSVLLVRPAAFGFHAEAAATNAFASERGGSDLADAARREFDALAESLDRAGVEVLVLDDSAEPPKPDAVFPNNWISFHPDGTVVVYPMATAARRLERDIDGVQRLLGAAGFEVSRVVDLSREERGGRFLEGTGSLVLDRPNRRAYASLSPRTAAALVEQWADALGYSAHVFGSRDGRGEPIYHTNVLLSLGSRFAVLCPEAVSPEDLQKLRSELESGGRTLIELDYEQLRGFACNILELRNGSGEPVIALSASALRALRPDQLRQLERFGSLVAASIPTIESVGGGSVRCMIADIHLPRR